VTIPIFASEALAAARAHAAAAAPLEACGLLLGGGGRVTEARACRNVAAEPAVRFEIEPAALLAAHRAARAGGAAVMGCYHSHPSGAARPSPRDAADAAPDGGLWLILGGGDATLWRAGETGAVHGRFDPVPLACEAVPIPPHSALPGSGA